MNRGLSLTESVVAVFLLVAGLVMTATLIHSGLGRQARTIQLARATLVAEKHLARLRLWATQPGTGGLNFDDWSTVNGAVAADPDEPGFTVQTDVEAMPLASPSTSLDADYSTDPRPLASSVMKVRVRVSWANEQIELYSLIADPPRAIVPGSVLTITPTTPVPNPVNQNGGASFTVSATDAAGLPIRDLFFQWYVAPESGNASITSQSRDGRNATFTNVINMPAPLPPMYSANPSTCSVAVRAVYRGQEEVQLFPVNLGP